jgi:hypothetical protein
MSTNTEQFVVGPDDTLVLVARAGAPLDELRRIGELIPKHLHGRVLIVSADDFDAKVVRG